MHLLTASVRWRFLALLGALLAAFASVLFGMHWMERAAAEQRKRTLQAEASRELARRVALADRPVQEFLADAVAQPELAAALATGDRDWPRAHLEPVLADRHVRAFWLLAADGRVAHHAARGEITPPPLPTAAELHAAQAGAAHRAAVGYAEAGAGGLWQLLAAPVRADDGRAAGWLLAGRLWDEALLDWLGELVGAEARLLPAGVTADGSRPREWFAPLQDFRGGTRRVLALLPADPEPAENSGRANLALFLVFALCLLTAAALALQGWVLRPLGLVERSLREDRPAAVEPLLAQQDEFSRVAALVRTAHAQRAELQTEIAERRRAEEALRMSEERLRHASELRERLARDLHDHVIQSIYAAGLGLESVRAQMSADPFGAEGRLRHCMDNLNDTIRQVRSYINDLEPDPPAGGLRFADAVRALTATMHELWPLDFVLRLEEEPGGRLTPVAGMHALQIIRECLSNAIRHGGATRVEIDWCADGPDAARLEVRDNGRGFDPVQRMGTGRGLVNLTTRAREMGATLRLDAAAGRGTRVALRIPLSAATP